MRCALPAAMILALIFPATLAAQTPVADYHQHLFSPDAGALVAGTKTSPGITARDVIALLDAAGIRHAVVLSMAYTWGKASRAPVENEYERVRAENDWTAEQAAQYPDRLLAFCSLNPLKPYALAELARCNKDPRLRRGLKLHFGNSDVDLDNPENVAQVRKVFAAANGYGMALVVHMRTSIDNRRKYGADQARVFLNEILPAAPDVPVQIAHLAGSGGFEAATDAALGVFADGLAARDPRLANVWFDAAVVVRPTMTPQLLQQIAARIRQIGVERVLYGSDAAASPLTHPKAGWTAFRRLPLTEDEFRAIAANVAPYMRDVPRASTAGQAVGREGYVDAGNGVKLYYRVLGTGNEPVVLVHGGPGFTSDYLADDLTPLAREHSLFVYDQRGIGRSTLVSDSTALAAERYVEDLEAIRKHLGLEKLTLFGHSWGAAPAALYAMQYPQRVRRMILVGPIPPERRALTRAFETLAAARDSATLRRMSELSEIRRARPADLAACHEYYRLWFTPFFASRDAASRMKGNVCAGSPESLTNKQNVDKFTFASLGEWDWTMSLQRAIAPTLIVHGALDPLPLEGARAFAASMPNARLLELKGIGHFPYIEAPEAFFAAVDRFLRGDWPDGAIQVRR